jgi:hypothetical protein
VCCRASYAAPRTAVTARKLQLHSHAQHAGPIIFNITQPTARATIPRFVCALFAVSASPSTPAAGTPLRSLTAEHAAARSPSALEGPQTRATYRRQLLLCPGRTARTPLRIAARALSLQSVRHIMLPPPFYSSSVSRPRAPSQNKLLVFVFCFCFA